MALPEIGHILGDRYRLVRKIGEGGMGAVYEALHLKLRQRVALKVLVPSAEWSDLVARFELEARVSASLRGHNVVRVIDVDRTPSGLCFMAMELLDGRDLSSELDARRTLPVETATDIATQVCSAMAEAHQLGVVHRDLKPPNVFLTNLGPGIDRPLVKVLDFGISKLEKSGSRKLTGRFDVFGTPYYMSPEHVRSASEVDGRSDIWSLGVLLFEMLTGRLPFEGTPTGVMLSIATDDPIRPTTLDPSIPPELEAIILKCLAKNPWERWGSMEELRAALAPFGPAEPIEAVLARAPRQALTGSIANQSWESTPPPDRPQSPVRRAFFLALAIGLPLVVAVVLAVRFTRPPPPPAPAADVAPAPASDEPQEEAAPAAGSSPEPSATTAGIESASPAPSSGRRPSLTAPKPTPKAVRPSSPSTPPASTSKRPVDRL